MVLGSILARDERFFSCFGQGSVVHIVTILLAGWAWVQILVGTKDLSLIWGRVVLLAGYSWVEIWVGTKDSSLVWGSVAWFI